MNVLMLLFVVVFVFPIHSSSDLYGFKVQIIKESSFRVPVNSHLIDTLLNIRSIIKCAILCENHIICRTADYVLANKTCRLFETLGSAGTFINDPGKSILILNYCSNDQQTEPNYICSRTQTYTVQQVFDKLSLSPNITLPSTDRGAYANMYGVYTSSSSGYLSFFTYTGTQTILHYLSTEITNINWAPNNGLSLVQYYGLLGIMYINNGNFSKPNLLPVLNISLLKSPYSILITSAYIYVTYDSVNNTIMTIHDLSSGLILFRIQFNSFVPYRPVLSEWNDTILVIDQYLVLEYTINGTLKGYWPYFSGPQSYIRHYIFHDYAGRRYTCNGGGSNPGIYAFLLNGTQLAKGPSSCFRAFQFYITKEQAMLINIPNSATMNVVRL